MNNLYVLLVIGIIALVTALLRFLPFMIFDGTRSVPKVIQYLGSVLPYAIMAMLVVYCLKDISFATPSDWLSELISVVVVIGLHVWKRNNLLSIGVGTVLYMVLIQCVF